MLANLIVAVGGNFPETYYIKEKENTTILSDENSLFGNFINLVVTTGCF